MTLCPYCGFTVDGPLHQEYCPLGRRTMSNTMVRQIMDSVPRGSDTIRSKKKRRH